MPTEQPYIKQPEDMERIKKNTFPHFETPTTPTGDIYSLIQSGVNQALDGYVSTVTSLTDSWLALLRNASSFGKKEPD